MTPFKFICKKLNNEMAVIIQYPDGCTQMIAHYILPPDHNWREDMAFYDGIVDCYKKRYKNIVI